MRRFSLALLVLSLSFGPVLLCQAQDFRPSQNFDLNQNNKNSIRSPAPQDGALTQAEYERRRLEYLKKNADQMGLDPRYLDRQLKELEERTRLDRQVEQARANQQQWQAQQAAREQSVDYDDQYYDEETGLYESENQYLIAGEPGQAPQQNQQSQEQMRQLEELQKKMEKGEVSMNEIFDTLNSISGSDNMVVPAKYQGTMSEQLYKAMSSMRSMPAQQLEDQLNEKLSEHPLSAVLSHAKPLIPDLVKIVQHPEALPDAALILEDRSKLIRYILWNIAIFIVNLLIRRRIAHSFLATLPKFGAQLLRWISVTGIRLGVFVAFFGENVKVIWQILTS